MSWAIRWSWAQGCKAAQAILSKEAEVMKVLISDNLHQAGVDILSPAPQHRSGVRPGLKPEELLAEHQGRRRPGHPQRHQGDRRPDRRRAPSQGGGPGRHRAGQRGHPGGQQAGHRGDEHPRGQHHHHRGTRLVPDDGPGPEHPPGGPLHAGGQVGEEEIPGHRTVQQDPGDHRAWGASAPWWPSGPWA